MKSGHMNKFSHILVMLAALLLFAGFNVKAESVHLPPLAKVVSRGASADSWRQSGEISGSVAGVHGDFLAALAGGGWILQKTITLGRVPKRSELMMWKKGSKKVLLMVWEKSAGRCGFSWGYE